MSVVWRGVLVALLLVVVSLVAGPHAAHGSDRAGVLRAELTAASQARAEAARELSAARQAAARDRRVLASARMRSASVLAQLSRDRLGAQRARARARQADALVERAVRSVYVSGVDPQVALLVSATTGGQWLRGVQDAVYVSSVLSDVARASGVASRAVAARERVVVASSVAADRVVGELALARERYRVSSQRLVRAREEFEQASQEVSRSSALFEQAVSDARFTVGSSCRNSLARVLLEAGFVGEKNRQAWAIAMRESGGRADAVSVTNDFGVFQFNKATYSSQPWWDEELLLTREYNAAVAFDLSGGGRSWIQWGLTGSGEVNPVLYERAGWSPERVRSHIVEPFVYWYQRYPCVKE